MEDERETDDRETDDRKDKHYANRILI